MLEDKAINPLPEINPVSGSLPTDGPVLEIWGGHRLSGLLPVSGAKNAALVVLAATLLCSDECRLRNIPELMDVGRMVQVLTSLGLKCRSQGTVWDIDGRTVDRAEAPYEIVSKLRASFFAIGPLIARMGEARVPLPGGCAIGARPVELHVRGLQAMGALVQIEGGIVHAAVPGGRLKGARIYLDYPSVGATETLMMAATLADGETVLENAAREPEVVDLANFCRAMGAEIRGAGTDTITVVGRDRLHGTDYAIVPDRIEAGTFLIAGAISDSELSVGPVVPEHMTATVAKLEAIGVKIIQDGADVLRVVPGDRRIGTDIETLPFPGFPTDMQAQFTTLLTLSEGSSVVTETVFENRMRHVAELKRLGANIRVKGRNAIIEGVPFLSGAPVMATDLRASAALVLAGLAARGKTTIFGLHHLDRGYERLELKLQNAGARIERLDTPDSQAPVPETAATLS
ncbi:MAG: UDP-N-acetylglucosamine 1-carboxyvinyltransferase [Cyanophyceae cyanobacterium]